jgi:hypothetical protein
MKQTTKNILIFIGAFIWAMKTTPKAYAPTIITAPSKPKKPTSQDDCEGDQLFRQIIHEPGGVSNQRCVSSCDRDEVKMFTDGRYIPGWYCEARPESTYQPKNTSCVPCNNQQYEGGTAEQRMHKSWCLQNC